MSGNIDRIRQIAEEIPHPLPDTRLICDAA